MTRIRFISAQVKTFPNERPEAAGLERSVRTGYVGAGRAAAPFSGGVAPSETRPKMPIGTTSRASP